MHIENEKVYGVDPTQMPDLSEAPYKDIEQVYLSPDPPDPKYPEVAVAEWRVRKTAKPGSEPRYTSAAKFGDKASGSRTEVETPLNEGAFGTQAADIERYGFGIVRKRRYQLPDEITVDRFDPDTHGDLWLAEREFPDSETADNWQPPEWCQPLDKTPSNRKLAAALRQSEPNKSVKTIDEVIDDIRQRRPDGEPMLVSISGMSGSGKSTKAKALAEVLGANHLETDRFHIGKTALQERFGAVNHDLPAAYDYVRAAAAAGKLLTGQAVNVPVYDFVTAEPLDLPQTVQPKDEAIVVVEGLYAALCSEHTAKLNPGINTYDILIKTPLYVCVLRRLIREAAGVTERVPDKREVSMTPEETLRYLMEVAIPTYLQHAPPEERFNAVVQ